MTGIKAWFTRWWGAGEDRAVPMLARHRAFGLAAASLLAAAFLLMREVNSLLLMLESAGDQSYGMSAVTGVNPNSTAAHRAFEFWARSGPRPFDWLGVYAIANTVFVVVICAVLTDLLRALVGRRFPDKTPHPVRMAYLLIGLLLVADVAENLLIGVAGRQVAQRLRDGAPYRPPDLATHIFWLGLIKWAAMLLAGAVLLIMLAEVYFGRDDPKRQALPRWWKVLWRLRVQAGIVAVLAFLVVVPSNDRLGALQQLPDVQRSYLTADRPHTSRLVFSILAPLVLGAALWVSAHWLPYGPENKNVNGWKWPYRAMWILGAVWLGVFVLQLIRPGAFERFIDGPPPWASSWQAGLPTLVGAALLFGVWLVHHRFSKTDSTIESERTAGGRTPLAPRRVPWHSRYGRTIHLLAVAPLAIAGLGLVRAAAGLALLPEGTASGVVGIMVGSVIAVVLAPVLLASLGRWACSEVGDGSTGQVAVPRWANAAVVGVAAIWIVVMASRPVDLGPMIGIAAVLVTALGAAAIILGGANAIAHRARVFTLNEHLDNTPATTTAMPAVLGLVLLVAAINCTDRIDTYHEAQTAEAGSVIRTLAGHFDAWKGAIAGCGVTTNPGRPDVASTVRIQPLIFAAAAGGGIRATYWTETALQQLTGADGGHDTATAACRRNAVFLVSAVSGGSVGAALWQEHPADGTRDAPPYTAAISGEDSLAALGATWLFRDLARAATTLDLHWRDRAAAMEEVWTRQLAARGVDLSRPLLTNDPSWRPLLLLNATDLQTGCRVLIGPVIADTAAAPLPRNCQEVTDRGSSFPGTYYATDFLDTSRCRTAAQSPSLATAALLSARFPYVTPTGLMFACARDGKTAVQLQVGDGGYLESSGIHAALHSWRTLEPTIAAHNRDVVANPTSARPMGNTLIVPVFVIIGNSYRSQSAAKAPLPQGELVAPIGARNVARTAISATRLEAEVRAAMSRPVPGTSMAPPLPRIVVMAPRLQPEVTAPLGWSLSDAAERSLDTQLNRLVVDNVDLERLRVAMAGAPDEGP
jgi:hypothetical protein